MTKDDKESIYICAVRYCMGRQSYMPALVINALKPELSDLNKKTLAVMKNDCVCQRINDIYGDETIDKPMWIEWEKLLEEEMERRKDGVDKH